MTGRIVRVTTAPARVIRVDPAPPRPVVRVGLAGPPGADGAAAGRYVHTQPTPALTWTINHNLGTRPAVAVFNSGSQEVMAEVQHVTDNQTRISFVLPLAGFARLT